MFVEFAKSDFLETADDITLYKRLLFDFFLCPGNFSQIDGYGGRLCRSNRGCPERQSWIHLHKQFRTCANPGTIRFARREIDKGLWIKVAETIEYLKVICIGIDGHSLRPRWNDLLERPELDLFHTLLDQRLKIVL